MKNNKPDETKKVINIDKSNKLELIYSTDGNYSQSGPFHKRRCR